jgi:hypothetical protein
MYSLSQGSGKQTNGDDEMATYSICSKLGTYLTGVKGEDRAYLVAKFVATFVDARGNVIGKAWYVSDQTGETVDVER